MKRSIFLPIVALAASAGFSVSVSAQGPSCGDVVWGADLLGRNPNVADHCLEVVDRGGVWYAKMRAKIVRQGVNSTVVRYADTNGDFGASERAYPPRGFTAQIDGQDVRISDMPAGQEVNVYIIDEGNFELVLAEEIIEEVIEEEIIEEVIEEEMYEEAVAELPTTAGQTYWLALLGSLLVLLGTAVHFVRSRV
jgi:(2Fe-2S) ferredoxin